MRRDISLEIGAHHFNYRVAAIVRREDAFLVCRSRRDNFCFLPGGRVQDGEAASDALTREELGLEVRAKRAVFFTENFFSLHGRRFHELCLYYEVALPTTGSLPRVADDDELVWLNVAAIADANLKPGFLAARLENLPETLEHLVLYDS